MNRSRLIAALAISVVVVFVLVSFGSSRLVSRPPGSEDVEHVSVANIQAPHDAHGLGGRMLRVAASFGTPPPSPHDGLQIARSGKLSLFVANIDNAVRAVTQVARRDGGDVLSLQSGDVDNGPPSADMQIRVPASRFDEAMNAAGAAGTVRSRSITAEDLTSDITDSGARLRNLRRTEMDILAIMDRSGSIAQVLDAENQLSQVREQIETLESQLKSMRGRVAYSTIDISMQLEAPPRPATTSPSAQLSVAWTSAVAALQGMFVGVVAGILWVIVFLPAIVVCALLAYGAYALLRRYQASRLIA